MNAYARVDALLAIAQDIVGDLRVANTDEYGLLKSAYDSIVSARADLDADTK